MKSGFVELVVKRALAGRAISHSQKSSAVRYRPIDSFKKFINNSLPEMQQTIQISLLKKNLLKIKDESIRTELINAYLRRLYRLRAYEIQDMKSYKQLKAIQPEQIGALKDPTILKNANEYNQFDVGLYALFTNDDMKKVFKHGCFGRYSDHQYSCTDKFGVMIRQESVSIGQVIKLIQQNKDIQVDWNILKQMSQQQKLEYINDQKFYPLLFQELSNKIYEKVQQYRATEAYNRVWGSSTITDIIVNSILQNAQSLNDPVQTAYQVIEQVMKIDPLPSPNNFYYRFRTIPGFPQMKTQTQLPENARFYCRTPSFKNFFLGGQGGTGRSMIIAYLSMLAHKNGWIVINVPNSYRWTHDTKAKYPRAYNGLYLINQHAVEWLDQFLSANKQILSKTPIDLDKFGKHDITGVHTQDFEPVPNFYYQDRKTHFKQIFDKFEQRLPQEEQQRRTEAKKRLTNILKKPKYISQIAEAGINNPEYATCAMGQILHQVYALNQPIIECVDSFNYLYKASYYSSFRYYNDRDLFGRIPPYHIAHCRMFVNLDGHKLKKGIKVVGASNYPLFKHKFNIKQMMFPENYEHKVRNLTQEQFRNAGQYAIINKWWFADQIQRLNINYAYTIAQGNWGDFQEVMKLGHYY